MNDLCETCIHARDSEGQPICHGFRWLIQMSEEIAAKVQDEDTPIMRLNEPLLAVTECRAYEPTAEAKQPAKVYVLKRENPPI